MTLQDICRGAKIECPKHLLEHTVAGISSRTCEIKNDYIFVCLRGTKTDGHKFIAKAFERGAFAVIIDNEEYACENAILVDDARSSLARIMNVFCGEPTKKLRFIGVTGTNGKTSVSVMMKNILDTHKIPCEMIGTLNNSSFCVKSEISQANFTTPDPEELYPMLQRIADAGIGHVIMESSSHALKLKKLEPIEFEIGIFTNLTEDHLDFHSTMEDYFKSKLELFSKCRIGIINIDDEYGERLSKIAPCKIKTCSMSKKSDYFAKILRDCGESGTHFSVASQEGELELKVNIPGRFSILNAMQSCACAIELKIDKNVIARSFESLKNVKGRLEKVELFEGRDFAVYLDYAHTPDALQKLLDTVNSFKKEGQRVVLLFGCGGDRERQKRRLMGEIAVKNADFVIITSDNPRSEDPLKIIEDICSGACERERYTVIPDRRTAIEYAIANAKAGDVIVLAGKGHENYEINARGVFPFDEREILRTIETKRRNES